MYINALSECLGKHRPPPNYLVKAEIQRLICLEETD